MGGKSLKSFNRIQLFRRLFTSSRILLVGFLLLILTGALLFRLPVMSTGEPLSFVDALFTATSAVCVTGLSVLDPGTDLTFFGQLLLMLLIQFGGLGFMTLSTLLMVALGQRIGLRDRLTLQSSLGQDALQGVVGLTLRIVLVTLATEGLGALLLVTRMVPRHGLLKGIWHAIFHSVSAFCNAGFDLGGGFITVQNDPVVLLAIMALITIGGLGFHVLFDIRRSGGRWRRLEFHSKLVLVTSASLTFGGALLFGLLEWENPGTLAAEGLHPLMRPMGALFQSVTCRTAGFATIDQAAMTPPALMLTVLLMFIGASPASTGGGIKTTTFSVFLLMVLQVLQGKPRIEVYKRSISQELVNRATVLLILAFVLIVLSQMVLTLFLPEEIGSSFVLYEVVSAFGTVGLTIGVTEQMGDVAKVWMSAVMYIGRVGLLTLAVGLSRRAKKGESRLSYPQGRLMIG